MTDSMFLKGYSQIKTQVKFASEFHREKKLAKKGEEVHKSTGQAEEEDEAAGFK